MSKTPIAKTVQMGFDAVLWHSHFTDGSVALPAPPVISTKTINSFDASFQLSDALSNVSTRKAYITSSAGTTTRLFGATTTVATIDLLLAATHYDIYFTDINVSGESSASNLVSLTTDDPPIFLPSAPTITLVSKTYNSVTIGISGGGSQATSFIPYLNGAQGAEFNAFPKTLAVNPSTPYVLFVQPKNSAGIGVASNSLSFTTDAAPSSTPSLGRKYIGLTGAPDWTNPADEVLRLSHQELVTLQLYPSIKTSDYANRIAAVRALNPNVKFLTYLNFSEIQSTSSSGVWGPYWTMINNKNWWARTTYPAGAITQIENAAVNLCSPRVDLTTGLTCGETFVDMYFSDVGRLITQTNGVMLDNFNFSWPSNFDYNEDGVNDSATSTAMMNAIIGAWTKIINRIKFRMPGALIGVNSRISTDKLSLGIDNRAAFKNLNIDYLMNQNAGPGHWYYSYGAFAFDGQPPSPWGSIRTYPGAGTQPTSTPTHGGIYRNTFGGMQRTANLPHANPSWMDVVGELQSYDYIANKANICMECYGFDEVQEQDTVNYPKAKQLNRLCYALSYVYSDITPYLLGIDSSPTTTGHCVELPEQLWDAGAVIDAAVMPTRESAPLITVNNHQVHYRRWQNLCIIVNPRYETTSTAPTPNVGNQPASITLTSLPALPPGKSHYEDFDGNTITAPVAILTDSAMWLKAMP